MAGGEFGYFETEMLSVQETLDENGIKIIDSYSQFAYNTVTVAKKLALGTLIEDLN